ncbi:NAD(P)-binding protein [Hortaea werneckii]|nr:NAD(P)-binding protein [Hortaea werneckii]KAI7303002.1 NAD(P)-binding protein [Hortaea werneckii]
MSSNDDAQILITGGSGFLGRGIVAALHEKHPKWRISILDRTAPDQKTVERLDHYFETDITSKESVSRAFDKYKPDLVVHTAGIVPARQLRYSTRKQDWERVKSINYEGTRNVLDASLAAGCKHFVYTSSCTAAIDDLEHDYYYMNESVRIDLATLHYGKSKGMAEQYVLDPRHAEKGLKACALRPCTIIGPGDVAVISLIHDLIAKNETYFIVGDGDNIYDFMYISNAVDAHVLAIENLLTSKTAAGEAFFISNQEPVYFWDFFAYIWAQFGHVPRFRVRIPQSIAWFAALFAEVYTWITGAAPTLDTGSVKDGIRTQYSNNNKARRILGYVPRVGIAEGVRLACEDYKKHLKQKEASNLQDGKQ